MVLVAESPAYVERAITLAEAEAKVIVKIEDTYGDLCRAIGAFFDLPDGWLQAMIYQESRGNPRAFRKEPNGWTGVGLLQITHPSLKAGVKDADLYLPAVNIRVGAKYIQSLVTRYGADFPKVAAAFNAGSVRESDANPWGMHMKELHVTHEVAALNSWTLYRRAKMQAEREAPIEPPQVALIDLTELAREEDERARRDTDPAPAA